MERTKLNNNKYYILNSFEYIDMEHKNIIKRPQIPDKVKLLHSLRQASREGAYEGVIQSKIDLLDNNLDYSKKDTPMTTREFEAFIRRSWWIKGLLLLILFLMGFIDFEDIISFAFNLF